VNAEHICVTFTCPPGQKRLHGNCPRSTSLHIPQGGDGLP
jgi:hypothetical protein